MAAFMTVQDVKELLGITQASRDDEIRAVLDATIAHVQGQVVVSLGENVTVITGRARGGVLFLSAMGATQLVQLEDPAGVVIPVGALTDVDMDAGIIGLPGPAVQGLYRATVQFPAATEDLKEACRHIIKHLWALRRGSQAGARGDADAQAQVLQGFAIPRRAEQLIRPYARTGGFA